MEETEGKVGIKFWIAALAFSTLLLATTFALLVSYLAEIKANSAAAVVRADALMLRNNILQVEVSELQHHILAMHVDGSAAQPAPAAAATTAPADASAPAAAMAPTTTTAMPGAPNAPASPMVPAIKPPTLAPSQP